jgi:nitronate monooxygenase
MSVFQVIQGGMGVGVSNWKLARAVSRAGQLGVVSGTAVAVLLARRLQIGDPEGHMRRGLAAFPSRRIADDILKQYFCPPCSAPAKVGQRPYQLTPMPQVQNARRFLELTVAANFVEVFLAKEGHHGLVGINLLEKIQMPTLASIYGAMLAGVDYILMGAGIPRHVPGILDTLAAGLPAELRVDLVNGTPSDALTSRFDPRDIWDAPAPALARPHFLAIVSSATLAMTLARKSNGRVDGFIVELATAGGHNAPPRGPRTLNARGEPIYGERDTPDFAKIAALGLPFYLGGGYGSPSGLARALACGARGIQVGTIFAFCEESGIDPELKRQACTAVLAGTTSVFTDPLASPTGFPFKVMQLPGTLSEPSTYEKRRRTCDLGYLRQAYTKSDGTTGYLCPAEPAEDYQRKGGELADTVGRKCLCNGLLSTLGLGQVDDDGKMERPIVTIGDGLADVAQIIQFVQAKRPGPIETFTAADVLAYLLQS